MFLHTSSIKKIVTMPAYILEDPNVSLAAKGLYIQLYYSNKSICSLAELSTFVDASEEELKKTFEELTEAGYVVIKNSKCELLQKAVSSKSTKKTTVEEATAYAETTQPKKLNIYEKMTGLVNRYDLPENVKQLLITYFSNWLGKKGRFAEADALHGNRVMAMIGDLISFHLSEDDIIDCIQTSIDKGWYKFVDPTKKSTTTETTSVNSSNFNKEDLVSGSYTQDEIDQLKERAKQLEADGKQGVY
jgi:DNA-binding transcriptional regulator YhcF (GntR family)